MSFSEWKKYRVGDIAKVKNGFAFKGKDFISSGVPVIKIKNVKPGKILLNELSYVSREVADNASKYKINVGDILIYYSENSGENDGKFGHTQIYVGSKSPSGWSSDIRDNYGVNFVYGNTTKYPSQCYSLYLYRVPNF
jgi:hypothetical protein